MDILVPNPDTGKSIDHALMYASLGWRVLPLRKRDKIPVIRDWVTEATIDAAVIRGHWERHPEHNLGILCGQESGLIVLDVDPRNNGFDSLDALLSEHGELPDTPTVQTGSGGKHYYFKHPGGGRITKKEIGRGLDLGRDGSQVVAPPSIHPNGTGYVWEDGTEPWLIDLAPLPEWIFALCGYEGEERQRESSSSWDLSSVTIPEQPTVIEGQRNNFLTAIGGHLRRIGLQEPEILAALNTMNANRCKPPLNTKEVRTISWSVARYVPAEPILPLFETHETTDIATIPAPTKYEVPQHFYNLPGLAGKIHQHIVDTAIKPQPFFALAGTLAVLGSLFGNRVQTWTGLFTNLYILTLAPSGAGKDHILKSITRLLDQAGEIDLLGGTLASDSGVLDAVRRNSCTLFLLDEFGQTLRGMTDYKSAPHTARIAPTLMSLYTSTGSVMAGKEFAYRREKNADNERRDIRFPCASFYATSTHDHVFMGLSSQEINDGLLGRILLFETDAPDPPKRKNPPPMSWPEDLLDAVRAARDLPEDAYRPDFLPRGKRNLMQGVACNPTRAGATQAALDLFDLFEDEVVREEKAKHRKDGTGLDALWARASEQAMKIAVILAAGVAIEGRVFDPEVTVREAELGIGLVDFCIRHMVGKCGTSIHRNDVERDAGSILKIIQNAGAEGITKYLLSRKTQWVKGRDRDAFLQNLQDAGLIFVQTRKPLGTGPIPKTFFAREFVPEKVIAEFEGAES